jgi:DNA replication protein DnaC
MEKLRLLRLDALAVAWVEQQKNPEMQKLAFDERLWMLVDAQWLSRENKRLARALKEAKLKLGNACVEDIDYPPRRELDKAVVRHLAACRWVEEHQNVVVTGSTGTGKTYLACALAQQACRKGYRAIYRRATRLTDELTLARADGTYAQLLGRFARADVLVIDQLRQLEIGTARRKPSLWCAGYRGSRRGRPASPCSPSGGQSFP